MRNKIIQNKTYHSETSATGGLFHHEINALLPLILSPKSEELLAKEVRENNVIQIIESQFKMHHDLYNGFLLNMVLE